MFINLSFGNMCSLCECLKWPEGSLLVSALKLDTNHIVRPVLSFLFVYVCCHGEVDHSLSRNPEECRVLRTQKQESFWIYSDTTGLVLSQLAQLIPLFGAAQSNDTITYLQFMTLEAQDHLA